MIAYDLECRQGHRFEGWFDSAEGFEAQQERHLVTCPVCGISEVSRVLSTFGIARHRHQENGVQSRAETPVEKIYKFISENFEDVGSDFAKEALKMHYGVTEKRNIRGVSSSQEEDVLKSEGIDFFKLPSPSGTPPSDSEDE